MPLKQRVPPSPPRQRGSSAAERSGDAAPSLGEGAAPRQAQRGAGSTGVAAGTRGEPAARRGDNCPRAGTSEPRHSPRTWELCALPPSSPLPFCHRVQSLQPPRPSSLCRRGTCPACPQSRGQGDGTARLPQAGAPGEERSTGSTSAAGLQKAGVGSSRAKRKPQTVTFLILALKGQITPGAFPPQQILTLRSTLSFCPCGQRGLRRVVGEARAEITLRQVTRGPWPFLTARPAPKPAGAGWEKPNVSRCPRGGGGLPAQGLG